ncbi:hypothetical protein [Anaerospora hongkongensis]|uniref:hypothetical protein n=1 Tax=Anaerospora hongkongensis TaxID=244830 RepID=UPI00289BEF24|nr:hypothetical protein [Anaerospora hongkongensis]
MAEDIMNFLTDEEKRELSQKKSKDIEAKADDLVKELEGLEKDKRNRFYREYLLPVINRLTLSKQTQVIRAIAKALDSRPNDIRNEMKDLIGESREEVPEWLDDDNNVVPSVLADQVMDKFDFVFDKQQIFIYKNGTYISSGADYIKAYLQTEMKHRYFRSDAHEVIDYVETKLKGMLLDVRNTG